MISRRLIFLTPVLLIAGIVVQVIALVLVIVGWIPCLIWPGMLNRPYQWITKSGAKVMARALIGSRRTGRVPKTETSVPQN